MSPRRLAENQLPSPAFTTEKSRLDEDANREISAGPAGLRDARPARHRVRGGQPVRALLAAIAVLTLVRADATAGMPCEGTGCGAEFIADGWVQIAACQYHNWSYLLQKGDHVILCTGVSSRAGPVEFPCQTFTGNVQWYRRFAETLRPRDLGAACWHSAAVTGAAEK
jgi:hypothetical protein